MMRRLIAIMLVMVSACPVHAVMTPEQALYDKVQNAIKTQNMKLLSDYEYDKIADYMSEGKKRWIEMYPYFQNEPFSGMTHFQEGLNISMAYAMSINPVETLKFVDKYNVDEICGVPFIEPTIDEVYSYYLKTRVALMAHGSENPWGAKCLSVLDNTMQDIKTLHADEK